MIKFHSLMTSKERFLQRNQQIRRKTYIICNRHKLQHNVYHKINLTKLILRRLASAIEHKKIKNLINFNKMLKLIYIDSNQYNIIIR